MAHEDKRDIYYYQKEKYQRSPAGTEIEHVYCKQESSNSSQGNIIASY